MILGTRSDEAPVAEKKPPRSPGDELRPGDILDNRFVITELMSTGGTATIFKALDTHANHQPVVLKVPLKQLEFDRNFF